MNGVHIIFPATDESALGAMLRQLTAAIDAARGSEGGYGLGGAHGYGAEWDSPVFMMHPFCWCDLETCPWCMGCDCPDGSTHYFVDSAEVTFDEWMAFYEREVTADIHAAQALWERQSSEANQRRSTRHDAVCGYCVGDIFPEKGFVAGEGAPNFWHKPSGLKVWWYKYIGRGMEIRGGGDLAKIGAQCLADIASVGRNAERQDPEEGLGPKDEHAVGEAETPSLNQGISHDSI